MDTTVPVKKIDWTSIDVPLAFEGKAITLPADPTQMPIKDAVEALKRIEKDELQEYEIKEFIPGAPWDGAVQVFRAMQDIYGPISPQTAQTFFGPKPPTFLSVNTGPKPYEVIQVPIGQMKIPNIEKPVTVHIHPTGTIITGMVKKKERAFLVEIVNLAKKYLKEQSVYKRKSIRIGVDENGSLLLNQQPEFLDLEHVRATDMIHTKNTTAQIYTNMFSPLRHTEACRKHKIPLKRGILLSGKYGSGKSLTARCTAKEANDNGWTFIMLDRVQGLKTAIEFARAYQPCVIFAEDIDRASDRSKESVNDLVNMLDGLITKDMEMMVVLTTNFIEKIDKALLRPGRFDAIINIELPDEETAIKLIRHYARDLLSTKEDLSEVATLLVGCIPSTIREVVERAKLSMLMESRTTIKAVDLHTAATGMKQHMLLLDPPTSNETSQDRLWNAMSELLDRSQLDKDNKVIIADLVEIKDNMGI